MTCSCLRALERVGGKESCFLCQHSDISERCYCADIKAFENLPDLFKKQSTQSVAGTGAGRPALQGPVLLARKRAPAWSPRGAERARSARAPPSRQQQWVTETRRSRAPTVAHVSSLLSLWRGVFVIPGPRFSIFNVMNCLTENVRRYF